MNDTTELQLGIHQAHEEHARLHQLLGACRAHLDNATRLTPAIAAGLLPHLTALQEHLATHFAHEEQGGWLEEAVIRLPRLAKQWTRLEKQHANLLRRLDDLVRQTKATANAAALGNGLARDFAAFTQQLLAHEACEERILQQGLNEDLDLCD